VTLLIDPPSWPARGRLWSHLVSDQSLEELHSFAAAAGIPSPAFERDHYDVPEQRYGALVAAGAVPVGSRVIVTALHAAGLRRRLGEALGPRRPGRRLLRPPRLHAGDRVAVVAPAGTVPPERLDAGIAVMQSWGLHVSVGRHVLRRHPRLHHLAGSDAERADDLTTAWTDPATRAVIAARGGSGIHRLLDSLDWTALAAAGPKLLVGFSDVSALHEAFAQRLGLVTVHGPVVCSLGEAPHEERAWLRGLLMDPGSLRWDGLDVLVEGSADGVLAGGNLAVLAAGLGTSVSRPATEAIVVLEEIREEPYRIDRMLTQLLRAGWFAGVRGVAIGHLTGCGDPRQVRAVLSDRIGDLGVPVLAGLPFGHEAPNLALPLGVRARLDTAARRLTLLDCPLR